MKERQHFLMESRLLLQTMGLWYWNLWARTAFLLCDFAIHKTIYFSRYFFMLKSTSTTHLLFSPIILVEHTFSKRLWASSFLTCKGRKWNGNILLCSERKIYLFSHFCSSSHFLDKDNYYGLCGRRLPQKSSPPVLLSFQQHKNRVLKIRAELIPFSGPSCITFFLLSSQSLGGVDHEQKWHTQMFCSIWTLYYLKLWSKPTSQCSNLLSKCIRWLKKFHKDKGQLWNSWNSWNVDVNFKNVWVQMWVIVVDSSLGVF